MAVVYSCQASNKVWLPQGVSEPAWGTRPLVRSPGWSRTQGVLTPPTRAQPDEPPLWSCFVYLGLGEWACLPPRRNPRPSVSSFLPLNNQNQITMDPSCTELAPLSALGHSNIKIEVSGSARTSPFICFGAHQYPNSICHPRGHNITSQRPEPVSFTPRDAFTLDHLPRVVKPTQH